MEIYLLRHGIAEELKAGQKDAERALVPEGKRKLGQILKRAKAADVKPELILTSPYKRAVETAELAAQVLEYQGDLLRTKALTPGSTPESVWEEIRTHSSARSLLLAGHEPLFSALTAYLLNAPSLVVDFKKGALVRVDLDQVTTHPRGVLRWMISPKIA